jgi:L-histidine N-alpha-methyltransferase
MKESMAQENTQAFVMEMDSIRCENVQVPAAGLELDFRNGETIHTENSCKFADGTLRGLPSASGFHTETTWKDARHWYELTLSRRREPNRCD